MVQLGELMMILELHRQGLSISAIARRTGRDPKTIRKYIERGIEAPVYGPRSVGRPGKLAPFMEFLRERVVAFPDLSAARLTREVRELGYAGAYTAVKRFLAAIRPENGPKPYEVRFETPPGVQAQVDFARFVVDFIDEPGTSCGSAWNKDPVFGVIGIQSGPRRQWVHSGFRGGHGSRVGDAGSGDDREDPSGVFRPEEVDQGDLPRVSDIAEGRAQGDPVAGDRVSLRARSAADAADRSVA